MMESGGLTVVNLGVDVAPEKFIEAMKSTNPRSWPCQPC